MMHPSWTGVRKQQYPHRFRQAVVSGRKTLREKVIVRRCIYIRFPFGVLESWGRGQKIPILAGPG